MGFSRAIGTDQAPVNALRRVANSREPVDVSRVTLPSASTIGTARWVLRSGTGTALTSKGADHAFDAAVYRAR